MKERADNLQKGPAEQAGNQQELAYEALRRGIVEFTYVPGQLLSAKEVRERLQLGRTPVREAIVRLQQEGLVVTKAKSGSYVSRINLKDAQCSHFLRTTVEQQIAIEASAQATDTDLATISHFIDIQSKALDAQDQRAFFDADNALHRAVFVAAHREREWEWLFRRSLDLNRFRWLHVKVRNVGWTSILKEHQAYYQALQQRRPLDASYIVEHHLHVMLDEKKEVFDAFPDYFYTQAL